MDVKELKAFEIPGIVSIFESSGGLPVIRVRNGFAEAEIMPYACHVTRFKPSGEESVLWLSPSSPFELGKGIRGGIPICFPWFGPHKTEKTFPVHGFVRYRDWELRSTACLSDGRTSIVLATGSDEASRAYWPHNFSLVATVTIGKSLVFELTAGNSGLEPFSYEDCLHTYFKVGDVMKAEVAGMDGVAYIDRTKSDSRAVQRGNLVLSGETVNAYMRDPSACRIVDPVLNRTIKIEKSGSGATVVWNPWAAAASKNAEIGDGWKDFLCVETATCLDGRITLLPGTSHTTRVAYSVEKS